MVFKLKLTVTNVSTGEEQVVTRECAERVKGKATMDCLFEEFYMTGKAVDVHFENEYDLRIEEDKEMVE